MVKSRLDQLLEFHKLDPEDPFILYGIALEYLNLDEQKAKEKFDLLLNKFPDYLPTYYHAAKLYEELSQNDKAEELYTKGIEISKIQKNTHTQRELQNALNLLLFDDDDF